MTELLVIGFGNELRSDDGAGRAVADAARRLPGVDTIAVHQLTPELAVEIGRFRRVVFVDADAAATDVRLERIELAPIGETVMSHHTDPAGLLRLSASMGEPPTEALLLAIPASDFTFGESFSPRTATAVRRGVELIAGLVHGEPARGV